MMPVPMLCGAFGQRCLRFGVALANGWNFLGGGKPVQEAYLAAFVLLGMVSLWFLWRSWQQRKDFAAAL
jgi:hypothetical protein